MWAVYICIVAFSLPTMAQGDSCDCGNVTAAMERCLLHRNFGNFRNDQLKHFLKCSLEESGFAHESFEDTTTEGADLISMSSHEMQVILGFSSHLAFSLEQFLANCNFIMAGDYETEKSLLEIVQLNVAESRVGPLQKHRCADRCAGAELKNKQRSINLDKQDFRNPTSYAKFMRYVDTVCNKCIWAEVDCGCSQGLDNPPFRLLYDYMIQYEIWQHQVGGLQTEDGQGISDIRWLSLEVVNGVGNQLLSLVNALMLAMSLGRAIVLHFGSRPYDVDYKYDSLIDFMGPSNITHPDPEAFDQLFLDLHMDERSNLESIMCEDPASFDRVHVIRLHSSAQDVHLLHNNPYTGEWLRSGFRNLPFFFISHFVWTGAVQRNVPVQVVTLPAAAPWDGLRTVEDLRAAFTAAAPSAIIALHARVCTHVPFHHLDHSHLLPGGRAGPEGDFEAFCAGDASSLDSLSACLESLLPPVGNHSSCARNESSSSGGGWPGAVVLWATDHDEAAAGLLARVAALPCVSVVRLQHLDALRSETSLQTGLMDLELLGLARRLVGTMQSTFSYAAHARALAAPYYGSFARGGAVCARGGGHPEAGLLSLGPMYDGCAAAGWNMTCARVAEECLGLLIGQHRLGGCLDHVASCRGIRGGGHGSGMVPPWAAELVVDVDHLAFLQYWWARMGGVFHLDFPHPVLPVCWPRPGWAA